MLTCIKPRSNVFKLTFQLTIVSWLTKRETLLSQILASCFFTKLPFHQWSQLSWCHFRENKTVLLDSTYISFWGVALGWGARSVKVSGGLDSKCISRALCFPYQPAIPGSKNSRWNLRGNTSSSPTTISKWVVKSWAHKIKTGGRERTHGDRELREVESRSDQVNQTEVPCSPRTMAGVPRSYFIYL